MEDLSGRSFGVYRIVEPLGAGGMASVYKAYQPAVDRHVALKVLPSHLARDPEFLGRFQQEAKVLAQLQHPHILPVHDFGESDGFTYIVMPFIKTGTLANALTGQPLEFEQIRRVITQVGDALDCAHTQGLVHRDVKPSNILIDDRGNCLLADFGIAKILEGADTLTATGGLIGTPKYMSPEQGMGNPIDGRSDIYSLGVVLYEMATGQVPYQAETPLAVVVKHIRDPLPIPSQVNPDIPEPLQRMIFRAMHKEPSERFASAGAMVDAMSAITLTPTRPVSGAVPPLPTVAMERPPGVDDVTVPRTATDGTAPPPTPPRDEAAGTESAAAAGQGAGQPPVATTETSGTRRPIAIGAAALVVLALLLYFMGGDTPDTDQIQVMNQATPAESDVAGVTAPGADAATPAALPAADEPARAEDDTPVPQPAGPAGPAGDEPAVTEPSQTTATPAVAASAGQPESATATAVNTPEPPRDTSVSDEPAVAADTPSDREDAVLEAAARIEAEAEEDRLRRDAEAAAAERDPFPDQGDGTFLDRQLGIRWTAAGSPTQGLDGLLWTDANSYCNGLSLAGASNWRLPTRDELDSVLQRLDPERYPWGLTLWSADRPLGESNRLWVTNSPLYAPEWSTEVRDSLARRLTHRAVCVAPGGGSRNQ
jgi:tRNA A-37 threonylcarbamoyl transferase component Bud32